MERTVLSVDQEDPNSASSGKHGGWITFPFIIATMGGTSLAAGGWINNLIVYLIQEFNVESISAAKIFNVVNGCTLIFPIVGAILADSFMGCFSIIWISSLVSLLGTLVLVLTAAMKNLRPPSCENESNICQKATQLQYAILYIGLALASLGLAGTRYTIGALGANQFDTPKHQNIFFNWYIFTLYVFNIISATAVVYVEDNVNWTFGFGICVVANVVGLIVFLAGGRFYRDIKPLGSPFARLGRVMLAAVLKRKSLLSTKGSDYYQSPAVVDQEEGLVPTKFLRFLNRAALKTESENKVGGGLTKPWELCTVEEVEDLKHLIKLIPLWSTVHLVSWHIVHYTFIFLYTPLILQMSLATIIALAMDRHMGPHFKIPAGSMSIFTMISTAAAIIIIERLNFPFWSKITRGRTITPLQRIGVGHLLTIASMGILALVECMRLKIVHQNHLDDLASAVAPVSVFWLVPSLAVAGVGDAFHFPGHVAFYYREFPDSLKSTSTAVVAVLIGIAFCLGNVVMDFVRRTTDWLPDDINNGRLDKVFWACCVISALNFGYYLVCALLYKYQSEDNQVKDSVDKK